MFGARVLKVIITAIADGDVVARRAPTAKTGREFGNDTSRRGSTHPTGKNNTLHIIIFLLFTAAF